MKTSDQERLDVVDVLFSKLPIPDTLFQHLDQAGAKPCSLLLKRALQHREGQDWEHCHEAAVKAREYAWEQLHRLEGEGRAISKWQSVSTAFRVGILSPARSLREFEAIHSCVTVAVVPHRISTPRKDGEHTHTDDTRCVGGRRVHRLFISPLRLTLYGDGRISHWKRVKCTAVVSHSKQQYSPPG